MISGLARAVILAALTAMFACGLSPSSCGDVLYFADGQMLFGRIESELPRHIVFRERLAGAGNYRQRTVRRDELKAWVRTIDEPRLEALEPGEWLAYRDLAEELAVQQIDPEAREMALRLYLIVARHAEGELRRAGFQGAISVGDSKQRRLLSSLAVQTLGIDQFPVTDTPESPERAPAVDVQDLREVLRGLREYRDGDVRAVERLADDPGTRCALEPFAAVCSWPSFRQLAEREPGDFAALARSIRLDVAIEEWMDGRSPQPLAFDSPWSVLASQPRQAARLASFGAVAPFDLEATRWRDGKWLVPQPGISNLSVIRAQAGIQSLRQDPSVIPAHAGIQSLQGASGRTFLGPRLRGDDALRKRGRRAEKAGMTR